MKYYFIIFVLLFSCKSTKYREYELLTDVLENNMRKDKSFLVISCENNYDFSDINNILISNNRKLFIEDPLYFEKEKNYWIFNEQELLFINEKQNDSIKLDKCWDSSKIKLDLKYISDSDFEKYNSMDSIKKYKLDNLKAIKKSDDIYIFSKPIFNKNKNKAFFIIQNINNPKDKLKIAVAKRINKKWQIIGYVYENWD